MKIKLFLLFIILCSLQTNAQTLTELQQQNARATGYAIVAARNPGKSFAILMIKWDGIHNLEYNANNQINPSWHPQAVVKGNYFDQTFDGTDFTMYSSVLVSQEEFEIYKSKGSDWWIVCSTLPSFSNSGLTIADNGNAGIGDSNPQSKLSLKEGGQHLNFITNKKLAGTWPPEAESTTMTIQSSGNAAGNLAFATGNSEAMRIIPNANVGIGTTNPVGKLDVNGAVFLKGKSILDSDGSNSYFKSNGISYFENNGRVSAIITSDGSVGIGTTAVDHKLTVNGTIHAKEIIVDTNITPDYVFQKYYTGKSALKSDYVMPTLAEIENFAKKNHHLPNVPSAQEVQQNGMSLGTMSNVLLQKVEELTLYAIEQNKVIEELKAQVKALMDKKQ